MKAPVVTSMTLDKPSYSKGDPVKLTIVYVPGTSDSSTATTYTATDQTTGLTGTLTITWAVNDGHNDPTTGKVTDTAGRSYSLLSDDGHTAVWQTVA